MTGAEPFRVTVWSKDMGTRYGWIGDPLAVDITERFNAVSTGSVAVSADARLIARLIETGGRVTVDYLPRDSTGALITTRRILSGRIRSIDGDGPASSGTVVLGVEGDWRLFRKVRGWPDPASALSTQVAAYYTATGAAETVLKDIVTANAVTRLGLPVTVAADSARGSSISITSRFHTIEDRLFPAVENAGLGVSAVQDDATAKVVVDVWVPSAYPRTLTESGGVIVRWGWSLSAPEVTRVIAGDQGEGAARGFTQTTDTARESDWADVIEGFVDARDTTDTATLTQRRADALEQGAPTSALSMVLQETSVFRYGVPGGVVIGDTVPVEVGPGVVISDRVRECRFTWAASSTAGSRSTSSGLLVSPVVGVRADTPETQLARSIRAVARAVANLNVGR